MANSAKRKGDRAERDLVHRHQALGAPCRRTLLSVQAANLDPGTDLVLNLLGVVRAQVKYRGTGYATLYGDLGTQDALFVRSRARDWLAVLPWRTWAKVLRALVSHGTDTAGEESVPREAVEGAVRRAVELATVGCCRTTTSAATEAVVAKVMVSV